MAMTALPPQRPDPWRQVWRIATGNLPLAASLFLLALYLLLLAWIPQFSSDLATADRWRAQARFGTWTGTMYRLGLFSLARSPAVPVLLSLLTSLLVLRTAEGAERLRSRLRHRNSREEGGAGGWSLLAGLGALILLAGLLIGHRWGWREEGLIGPETAPLPDRAGGGARPYLTGFGPALTVRAADNAGRPLQLRQNVREPAQTELILYLTPSSPERSFAIPESGLVVRLGARGDLSARTPILVEVFRAPAGERVREATMEEDRFSLEVDGVNLEISRRPYPLLAQVYDPGLWPKWVGLVLGTLGLVGMLSREKPKARIGGLILSGLTVLVAGLAGYSLGTRGMLEALPLQPEVTALWLIGLGLWLIGAKG